LNNKTEHETFGPYTNIPKDARDAEGVMHFTKDQIEVINLWRRTLKFSEDNKKYVGKKM